MNFRSFTYVVFAAIIVFLTCCRKNSAQSTIDGDNTIVSTATPTGNPSKPYGCFTIINSASNKVLEVRNDTALMRAKASPANVQQFAGIDFGTGTAQNQKWYIVQQGTGIVADSTQFKIVNVASGLYLEASNNTNKASLYTNHVNNSQAQIWYLVQAGNNNYYIKNKNGLVLGNDGKTDSGAPVTLNTRINNNKAQYWTLQNLPPEAYRDDEVVQYFRRNLAYPTKMGSIAFDQVSSIPLSDGRTLWIAEDTYTDNIGGFNGTYPCQGDGKSIWFFDIRNSILIQPSANNWDNTKTVNMQGGNSAYAYEIFKSPGTGSNAHVASYTWPGVGIEINDHVYIYAHEGGKNADNSPVDATVLYDFKKSAGLNWGTPVRLPIPNLTDKKMSLRVDYAWGIIRPDNGNLGYAYGTFTDDFGGTNLLVARFDVKSPSNWTFWNGSDWVVTPSDGNSSAAQLTVNGKKSVAANSSVAYINGKYVLVEMDFGYLCPDPNQPHNIYISTSTNPTGPFINKKRVYTIQDKINGVLANHYVINIHPQFNNSHNELLVTYCLNYSGCSGVAGCTGGRTDPYYYQAKAVRIPYSIAGL